MYFLKYRLALTLILLKIFHLFDIFDYIVCEYLIAVIALAVKAARVTTLDTVAELHLLGFSYDFAAG